MQVYGYTPAIAQIISLTDPAGRSYSYGYESVGGQLRLKTVTVSDSSGTVAEVEYAYYGDGGPGDGLGLGLPGDLKLVTIRTQLTETGDESKWLVRKKYVSAPATPSNQRATNIASGFDSWVNLISTTYDALGRRKLVTQYDDTTNPDTVRNEVANTYDDWGNLSLFEQDRNSTVGASGSMDDYEVSYTYAKATGGRNTIRRATEVIPSGATVSYDYLSAGGVLDDKASRVSQVRLAASPAIVLAKYFYNGPADVVGTESPGPAIQWHRYGSTSGVYPDLDRFNRVTTSRWTRVVTPSGCTGGGQANPDFYNAAVTYDRNSNVDLVIDNIFVCERSRSLMGS